MTEYRLCVWTKPPRREGLDACSGTNVGLLQLFIEDSGTGVGRAEWSYEAGNGEPEVI